MANVTTVSSDPFARTSLMRQRAYKGECEWCGTSPKHGLFRYWHEADGRWVRRGFSPLTDRGFCSVGCFRAYGEG